MPNKLRDLSGEKIIKFLENNGFSVYKTRGSHCKIRRTTLERNQNLTIPLHKSIAKGTLNDIYNQVLEYLPEGDIKSFFFTE